MIRIYKIEFDWYDGWDQQKVTELNRLWPEMKAELDDQDHRKGLKSYQCSGLATIDAALKVGQKFHVIEGTRYAEFEDLAKVAPAPVNERCNVVVNGADLTRITKVQVIEDCCTDVLQQHLNDGAQIIAVCVQPDQRRPDYVLGYKN